MSDVLTFEAEGHRYTLNGRAVPSVTRVLELLEDFSQVDPRVLEAARVFGSHVHEACALELRGQLDWVALSSELKPYIEAMHRFLNDTGVKVIASEQRVWHRKLGYAGTLDLYGRLDRKNLLIDFKSGVLPPTVGPQTAAYEQALLDSTGMRTDERYCLQLNPELPRGYKLNRLNKRTDWNNFLSALNCHRFKREAHGHE